MARRRVAKASVSTSGRWALTNRSFADSIQQLTEEAIKQSLEEIEKEFQKKYGKTDTVSGNRNEADRPIAAAD